VTDPPAFAVRGDVDLAAVPDLDEALEAAIRESTGAFVVDLTDVAFIDSTGLQLLLRARALLGREDRALVLVCPHGPVRRVFELAGVSDVFLFCATPAAAAAKLKPRPGPARA
jgi:anti-sigma B factor antagonist